MENDLISRTAVLKLIEDIKCDPEVPKNYGTLLDIMRKIRKIPTSYDVDKVVNAIDNTVPGITNMQIMMIQDIVKSGGID